MVLSEHNPPEWTPKENLATPMLWVAAEKDAVISLKGARDSAAFYGAALMVIPGAGHNLMMEHNQAQTLAQIEAWLSAKGL